MSNTKVTIQDIADSLGLSRNTVSKALNGSDAISEDTRNKVFNSAIKLKYKQFEFMVSNTMTSKTMHNVALLTSNMPNSFHFGSLLLSGLEKKISDNGCNLSIHILRETELRSLVLPNNFGSKSIDGIICIELFNKDYMRLIGDLGIPTIYIDSTPNVFYPELNADILLMENEHSTYAITKKLIDSGYTSLGFIGDYNHCKSFNERWLGFNRALLESNIRLDLSMCIVEGDECPYTDYEWLKSKFNLMKKLPSAFVCANDFIAISVMKALKMKNVKIPQEVAISGFDDSSESRVVEPHLTTVHIPSSEMGVIAAEMLFSRFKNPSKPFQITHVKTEPVFRASTSSSAFNRSNQ